MKRLLLFLCLFLFALVSNAQHDFDLNLFLGTSNYSGDLQDKRFTLKQAQLAGGIGLSYAISDHFTARASFKIGKISADDKVGRNRNRNLNFSSEITEGSLNLQYLVTPLSAHVFTPYLFAGVAIYHFDPFTHDSTGRKYYLKPLSTEGEGFISGRNNYSLTQFSIPLGAGVKMPLSDNITVGFEVGYRKLFTDYLDDVSTTYVDPGLLLANRGTKALELAYRGDELKAGSNTYPTGNQRGNSRYKDLYYFTGLTLSFRLSNSLFGNGGGGKNEWDCPKIVL